MRFSLSFGLTEGKEGHNENLVRLKKNRGANRPKRGRDGLEFLLKCHAWSHRARGALGMRASESNRIKPLARTSE